MNALSFVRRRVAVAARSLGPVVFLCASTVLVAADAAAQAPSSRAGRTLRPHQRPVWADAPIQRDVALDRDPSLDDVANGARFVQAVAALQPGDRLLVGAGTWSIPSLFIVRLAGTAQAPIRIEARPGTVPRLTRPDAGQNLIEFGDDNFTTRFLALSGFELTGASIGLRLRRADDLWFDELNLHHTGGDGLRASEHDTARVFVTRCEVAHTAQVHGTGEALYIGANHGTAPARDWVVALNHVHHTGGPQGDGIELKQGSSGCRIEENTVHDTNYPGILAYGSDGGPRNVIEGNVIWAAATNPFQVQGEALVRNNLVFGGATPAFVSFDHQGSVRDLTVVHNTFVTTSAEAARLGNWSNRPGMVLANNALYSESGLALSFLNGASGVTIEGNVVHGGAYNDGGAHHQAGLGVTDFVALRFDGTLRDAHPSVTSRLVGAASTAQIAPSDASGAERSGERSAGAYERGTYGRYVGASVAGANGAPLLRSPGLPSPAGPPVTFTLIHAAPHAFAMHGVVWIPTGAPYSVERSVSVVNAAGEATFLVDPPTLPGAARARVVVRDATAPGGVAATQWIEW